MNNDKKENNTIENQKFALIQRDVFETSNDNLGLEFQDALKNKELYSLNLNNIEKSKYSYKFLSDDFVKNISQIKSDYQKYILIKF